MVELCLVFFFFLGGGGGFWALPAGFWWLNWCGIAFSLGELCLWWCGSTVFPRFSAPVKLQILISAPPSDKRPLQISLDFDQKDGEPELFLNQLTSKSLGLFFFIEYSVKYLHAVQKMISS